MSDARLVISYTKKHIGRASEKSIARNIFTLQCYRAHSFFDCVDCVLVEVLYVFIRMMKTMLRQLNNTYLIILIALIPSISNAEVNVCVENGVKVFRSTPCKGNVQPQATYISHTVRIFEPANRPIENVRRPNPYTLDRNSNTDQSEEDSTQYSPPNNNTPPPSLTNSPPVMVSGGNLNGSMWPGSQGGMIIGGPLSGSILPDENGGIVVGGPSSGSIWPGGNGGMVTGGTMSGSIIPGKEGGMIIGGPYNGSIIPPR